MLLVVGVVAGLFGMQFVPDGSSGPAAAQAAPLHAPGAHVEPESANDRGSGDPAAPGNCGTASVAHAATSAPVPFAIHADRAIGSPVEQQDNDPPRGLATEAFAQPPSLIKLSIRRV